MGLERFLLGENGVQFMLLAFESRFGFPQPSPRRVNSCVRSGVSLRAEAWVLASKPEKPRDRVQVVG